MHFVYRCVAIQPSVSKAGNTFVARVSILEEDGETTSLGDLGHFAKRVGLCVCRALRHRLCGRGAAAETALHCSASLMRRSIGITTTHQRELVHMEKIRCSQNR